MITSLKNSKIKEIIKLKNKKYRDRLNKFLVFDEELILKHLDKIDLLVSTEDFKLKNQLLVSEEVMLKIKDEPLKMLGVFNKFKFENLSSEKIIALDNVQDPYNIAMILQAMAFYGFDLLILNQSCADIYQEKVIKVSKDDFFKIKFYETDLKTELLKLQKQGYQIYSTGLNNISVELKNLQTSDKFVLVLGNEGQGVSLDIMDISDEIVKISMNNLDSLNVSLAANIIMYYLSK